tara:strand:- start:2078 stop:3355 length:1278 start_codon:yes stop_codon:yes gene_type:complete
MKIPFTNIEIGKIENKAVTRKRRDMADIIDRIKKTQLVRAREDVKKWRDALNRAESHHLPDRGDLIRIFKDITLDAHLSSLMTTIILKTTSAPFFIQDENGEIDKDATETFKKKWFRGFAKSVVEAPLYGFSLVQFGDIMGNEFKDSELVPREYVIPEKRAVKKHLYQAGQDLTYFDDRPFDLWTIFIHEKYDLGLLTKAAPLVIWKKNVLGAWSEAAELFGMPIRVGKTDINNPVAYKNMTDMLENMGSAAWAVMDNDDEIDLKEITKSDYYNVYDKLIDRVNSELSKLILGQTMSSDDGSSQSQAEVHERVLDDYVSASKMLVADVVNDQLLPLMVRHGMIKEGLKYVQDNEQKIDIKARFEMVNQISRWPGAKVPLDYVTETFGIPLEEVEAPAFVGSTAKEIESVMPSVKDLYKEIQEHKH